MSTFKIQNSKSLKEFSIPYPQGIERGKGEAN
jgi:hypothetical protein